MNGQNTAVVFTFLWSLAYGFVISIILYFIIRMSIPIVYNDTDTIGEFVSNTNNMVMFIGFASLFGVISHVYLTFSKCYTYGISDCKEERDKH